jgi:TRAP-type C4-dicarboxylate transport system substrate-binding protein
MFSARRVHVSAGKRSTRFRLAVISAAALTSCAMIAACGGSSGGSKSSAGAGMPKVTLQLEAFEPSTYPMVVWAQEITKKIASETGGAVQIKIYPNSELVSQTNAQSSLQSGAVDMGMALDANLSTLIPGWAVSGSPFFSPSYSGMEAIYSNKAVYAYENQLLEPKNLHILMSCPGGPDLIETRSPVSTLSQLKGVKVRVNDEQQAQQMTALGAVPEIVALGDTYTALQTNSLGGMNSGLTTYFSGDYYQIIKYVNQIPVAQGVLDYLINTSVWNKLSSSEQTIVGNAFENNALSCAQMSENEITADEATLKSKGVTFVTPASLTPFENATASQLKSAENQNVVSNHLTQLAQAAMKQGAAQ